jgi:thiamine biosynthesis lipoprotein
MAMSGDLHGFRFAVLGCSGRLRLAGITAARAEAAVADAVRWLRGIEARLTRFRADSLVGRLNAGEVVPADAELLAVLDAADRASRLTDGRFDATAAPLWSLWHDPARSTWPSPTEIAAARTLVDMGALVRDAGGVRLRRPGMALDLGGVGKEWCVDRLIERLAANGADDVLVELGGDCRARGRQPGREGWWVLLPGAAATLLLRDQAIATSGVGTRRRLLAGREVPHLIDARSGLPAAGSLRSATVVAADCLTAGIHASDLCLLEQVTADAIAARSGGCATWCRAADGRLLADPRLLALVHPVAMGMRAA